MRDIHQILFYQFLKIIIPLINKILIMMKINVIINSNYLNKKFYYFKKEKKKFNPFTRRNEFDLFKLSKLKF